VYVPAFPSQRRSSGRFCSCGMSELVVRGPNRPHARWKKKSGFTSSIKHQRGRERERCGGRFQEPASAREGTSRVGVLEVEHRVDRFSFENFPDARTNTRVTRLVNSSSQTPAWTNADNARLIEPP
jgi:hypothetical protein